MFLLVASSIIPLITIQIVEIREFNIPTLQFSPIVSNDVPVQVTNPESLDSAQRFFDFNVLNISLLIYIIGVFVFAIRTMIGLFYLAAIVKWTSVMSQNKIIYHSKDIPPFSFFNYIFLQSNSFSEDEVQQIIEHERTHKNLLHSIDVLFVELLVALHWINPFIWVIRNSIKENHEHFVDRHMLDSGIQKEPYFRLILSLSNNKRILPATNSIINPDIKTRIKMTTKQKSKPISTAKLLLAVPFLLFMIYSFSISWIPSTDTRQDQFVKVPFDYNPSRGVGVFKIDGIRNYPENEITIYNKFGEVMVAFEEYDNSWGGKVGENKDDYLLTDLYLYVIKLEDDIPVMTGYILIFHPEDGVAVAWGEGDQMAIISFPEDRSVIVHHTIPEENFLIVLDGEKISVNLLRMIPSSEISGVFGVSKERELGFDYDRSKIVCVFELQRK